MVILFLCNIGKWQKYFSIFLFDEFYQFYKLRDLLFFRILYVLHVRKWVPYLLMYELLNSIIELLYKMRTFSRVENFFRKEENCALFIKNPGSRSKKEMILQFIATFRNPQFSIFILPILHQFYKSKDILQSK